MQVTQHIAELLLFICSLFGIPFPLTHQIASDVTTLAERYEVTLGATESKVNDLEQEVLRSLTEMSFTL